MNDALTYKIAFASLRGINRVMAEELLARVGSERAFFDATRRQLASAMGFDNNLFDDDYRAKVVDEALRETDFIGANGIRPLYYTDKDYPVRLAECDDAPLMLFTLGSADFNSLHFISVVGTRHATPYGIDFVNHLVADLASTVAGGVAIVSGLAFGIDVAAHSAALKCGVPTIAVLAHGLNMIYPAQHRSVAVEMVRSGGALVSDYHSGAPVHKGNFVARNRIVAGLCDCLVVAESAVKGGALITANIASGYNRDVFALPGRSSDRYSAGCNRLIASNVAALVENASDVIAAMNWEIRETGPSQQSLFVELSAQEQAVMDILARQGEASLNTLAIGLDMNAGRLMSLLIDMEFKGLIMAYPGGKYRPAASR